jgi:hypothetical protein
MLQGIGRVRQFIGGGTGGRGWVWAESWSGYLSHAPEDDSFQDRTGGSRQLSRFRFELLGYGGLARNRYGATDSDRLAQFPLDPEVAHALSFQLLGQVGPGQGICVTVLV